MKLPKRPDTHLIEADSWRLLQSLAPENWIVREISERDYGIDAYIEIASDKGEITGDLFLAQLKGVKAKSWKSSGCRKFETSRSPQIKTATANYWLRLPVPVFLLIADLSKKNIFWCNTKRHIREKFDKLSTNDSLSFQLHSAADLLSTSGRALHKIAYLIESDHVNFSSQVTSLISNARRFADFIHENVNRDIFMEVESDRHLEFRALYMTCRNVAMHLQHDWSIPSLRDLYSQDREEWKDNCVWLHCPSSSKWNRCVARLSECFAHRFHIMRRVVGTANDVSRWSFS